MKIILILLIMLPLISIAAGYEIQPDGAIREGNIIKYGVERFTASDGQVYLTSEYPGNMLIDNSTYWAIQSPAPLLGRFYPDGRVYLGTDLSHYLGVKPIGLFYINSQGPSQREQIMDLSTGLSFNVIDNTVYYNKSSVSIKYINNFGGVKSEIILPNTPPTPTVPNPAFVILWEIVDHSGINTNNGSYESDDIGKHNKMLFNDAKASFTRGDIQNNGSVGLKKKLFHHGGKIYLAEGVGYEWISDDNRTDSTFLIDPSIEWNGSDNWAGITFTNTTVNYGNNTIQFGYWATNFEDGDATEWYSATGDVVMMNGDYCGYMGTNELFWEFPEFDFVGDNTIDFDFNYTLAGDYYARFRSEYQTTINTEHGAHLNQYRYHDGVVWNNVTGISPNTWYHITAKQDLSADTSDYYINYVLQASGASNRANTNAIDEFYFFTGATPYDNPFYVDNVWIFNSSATYGNVTLNNAVDSGFETKISTVYVNVTIPSGTSLTTAINKSTDNSSFVYEVLGTNSTAGTHSLSYPVTGEYRYGKWEFKLTTTETGNKKLTPTIHNISMQYESTAVEEIGSFDISITYEDRTNQSYNIIYTISNKTEPLDYINLSWNGTDINHTYCTNYANNTTIGDCQVATEANQTLWFNNSENLIPNGTGYYINESGDYDCTFEYWNGSDWVEGESYDYIDMVCYWWGVCTNSYQTDTQPTLRITNNDVLDPAWPKIWVNTTNENINLFVYDESDWINGTQLSNTATNVLSTRVDPGESQSFWAGANLTFAELGEWNFEVYASMNTS